MRAAAFAPRPGLRAAFRRRRFPHPDPSAQPHTRRASAGPAHGPRRFRASSARSSIQIPARSCAKVLGDASARNGGTGGASAPIASPPCPAAFSLTGRRAAPESAAITRPCPDPSNASPPTRAIEPRETGGFPPFPRAWSSSSRSSTARPKSPKLSPALASNTLLQRRSMTPRRYPPARISRSSSARHAARPSPAIGCKRNRCATALQPITLCPT